MASKLKNSMSESFLNLSVFRNADVKQWKNAESTTLCSDGVRCVKFVGTVGNHFLAGLNNGDIVVT